MAGASKTNIAVLWLGLGLIPILGLLAFSADPTDRAILERRLQTLGGPGAIACGLVEPTTDATVSSKCILDSFAKRQPFYVVYEFQTANLGSHDIDALAGDSRGSVYDVEFSSRGWEPELLRAGSIVSDGGHIFAEPCRKPITFRKSVYGGLTCLRRLEN